MADMKIQSFTWLFTIMLIFLQHNLVASSSAIHLSRNMQKIALFQFKRSLVIRSPTICSPNTYKEIRSHPKTMNWSMSSDHCTWEGVTCEQKTGNVIGLDLTCSQLVGAILPNNALFQLSHLQFLNLSWNYFYPSKQIPAEFGLFLTGLTHLNLSHTQFSGNIPIEISHLYKLVSLDLSDHPATLEYKVFEVLLQNLTQLRVVNFERLEINSVLPVNLSSSLRVLNLKDTGLHGVPQEVFHLPNLEVLDLSWNSFLTVTFPTVKWGSSATLKDLNLAGINLHENLPNSIVFPKSLATLRLYRCNLSGSIPRSIWNLGELTELDLSWNHLSGQIPKFVANHTNLKVLLLSHNKLTGQFPSFVTQPRKLIQIDLGYNSLTGPLPPWLFDLPYLKTLNLEFNGFTGQLYGPQVTPLDSFKSQLQSFYCRNNSLNGPIPQSFSQLVNLTYLDLSSNNFNGSIPQSFSQLVNLTYLDLSSNNFNGSIPQSFSQLVNLSHLNFSSNHFSGFLDIEMFQHHKYLNTLDLSGNSLSVRSATMATLPPKLSYLDLSSCSMKEFPHFSENAEIIHHLDLSNNQIEGEIPHGIGWLVGGELSYVNFSYNNLTGGLEQLHWNDIWFLYIQSNMLNGSLPISICDSSLTILNLSHNKLSGELPICPTFMTSLLVLDLQMNNIQGILPSSLPYFRYLISLNLHGNKLEGGIPSSFAGFDQLKVLDLGSNQINDTFPQCLEALPSLEVLVLKSNKFHGRINTSSETAYTFPNLRIIDLSYNEFSGPLPAKYFKNFHAMMDGEVNKITLDYMGDDRYRDTTRLVIKGVETVLQRILTVFTAIDLSRNNFEEEIDDYIGNLVSLRYLNFSMNHLTGYIPSSIGKLSMLESLDLSFNQFEGHIPQQLTDIYSLAVLNLSCNQLKGHIPQGSQFYTFENNSYVGNFGLCGHPLSKKCEDKFGTQGEEEIEDDEYILSGFTWGAVVIGYGCGVVPAFIGGYLMLLAGKPKWFAGIIARELGLKIRRMEIRMQ